MTMLVIALVLIIGAVVAFGHMAISEYRDDQPFGAFIFSLLTIESVIAAVACAGAMT